MSSWQVYNENRKKKPPSKLLEKALLFLPHKGRALDLGSGPLVDAKYLESEGFMVEAVDSYSGNSLELEEGSTIVLHINDFNEYEYPTDVYELINAQYSLPFIEPKDFHEVFAKIRRSLKLDGIFVGQLFGPNDQWNTQDSKKTFLSGQEIQELFTGFEFLEFEEKKGKDFLTAGGDKYWHLFNVIARKKVK